MAQHFRDEHFVQLLMANYTRVKTQFPHEGRRRWHLRVLQDFWVLDHRSDFLTSKAPADAFMEDADPLDDWTDGDEPGIILRTDYSDESAWQTFRTKLEEEMKAIRADTDDDDVQMVDMGDQNDPDSASDESGDTPALVKVISAPSPELRNLFNHVPNITALRLLNDVDIRPCPTLPEGMKQRIHPPNRLVDQGSWQEIYVGPTIWIYDTQSNNDQCARLVSQQGDIYGTATGDSWRARVTHICELQFNLTYLGMKIDFGGLDRWDYNERKRNLDEAVMLQAQRLHSTQI